MKPLAESFANGDAESELRDLLISLYDDTLADQAEEISYFGAPQMGPFSLVQRGIAADGLSVINQNDETSLRYLFKAWRFRNPRRGTHFLSTYLTILFGDSDIQQMWMPKATASAYPTGIRSEPEITQLGGSTDDYFLTSRLRVDLTTDIVAERILRSIKSAVAARLVLQVRIVKRTTSTVGTKQFFYGTAVGRTTGELVVRERDTQTTQVMASRFGGSGLAYLIN